VTWIPLLPNLRFWISVINSLPGGPSLWLMEIDYSSHRE